MEEVQQSKRIQTSLLNAAEKKVLVWLAERMPAWMTSDFLTFIGFLGSVLIALGFILAGKSIHFLWLAIAGFIVNWYGDSLDGTLARVRNTQRPIYGFYLDHTMDCVNEMFMFVGIGLSPFINLAVAVTGLQFYLLLTLNVTMNAHLRKDFRLTYAKLGPTEFRIIMILVCLAYILIPAIPAFSRQVHIFGQDITIQILDIIGTVIVTVLAFIYFFTIIGDIKFYNRLDPPKKYIPTDSGEKKGKS